MGTGDDILKGAGRLFGKVGGAVKQASKQVTGIGLGVARLALPRTRFAPGDTISASVVLQLPEPVDARRFAVGVRAFQRNQIDVPTVLYKFERDLGGAQQYTSGEHQFELPIPADALELRATGPIEWQVWTVLEIPWSRNVDHSIDIVVAK